MSLRREGRRSDGRQDGVAYAMGRCTLRNNEVGDLGGYARPASRRTSQLNPTLIPFCLSSSPQGPSAFLVEAMSSKTSHPAEHPLPREIFCSKIDQKGFREEQSMVAGALNTSRSE